METLLATLLIISSMLHDKELQDELGALGYRVKSEVGDSCFSVWWG